MMNGFAYLYATSCSPPVGAAETRQGWRSSPSQTCSARLSAETLSRGWMQRKTKDGAAFVCPDNIIWQPFFPWRFGPKRERFFKLYMWKILCGLLRCAFKCKETNKKKESWESKQSFPSRTTDRRWLFDWPEVLVWFPLLRREAGGVPGHSACHFLYSLPSALSLSPALSLSFFCHFLFKISKSTRRKYHCSLAHLWFISPTQLEETEETDTDTDSVESKWFLFFTVNFFFSWGAVLIICFGNGLSKSEGSGGVQHEK